MPLLHPIRPDAMDEHQRALYDALVSGPRGQGIVAPDGTLRGPFDPLLRTPHVGDAVQALGAALRFGGRLRGDLRELAVLTVASAMGCSFEIAAHQPLAEREGVPSPAVTAVVVGATPAFDDEAQRAVHAAVLETLASAGRRLSRATTTNLIALLGEDQVVELLIVVGYYALLATLLETFEITTDTGTTDTTDTTETP